MNINELKELILWCKINKIKSVTYKDCSFEISDIAFVETLQGLNLEDIKEEALDSTKTMVDTLKPEKSEEDEDLFWSVSR